MLAQRLKININYIYTVTQKITIMTTEQEISELFTDILNKYIEEVGKVAHEDNSQIHDTPNEKLNDGIKKQTDICLSILVRLYGEYIKPEGAHISNLLEFIPLFGVFGMWIGAQIGVSQDTYNAIVDHYLEKLELVEK